MHTVNSLGISVMVIRPAIMICVAAMLSLAVAMGVGRFAFTPLFPLMVRDGLLPSEAGALLAASNYLGYLIGALLAARIRLTSAMLMALGLVGTVLVTAAVGWTSTIASWTALRFAAGVLSAWSLVATTTWVFGWLAAHGRPQLAGVVFSGVGLGVAGAGMYCLLAARPLVTADAMWVELAVLAAVAAVVPLWVSRGHPAPTAATARGTPTNPRREGPADSLGLVVCYTLFGFGYILPATYLPALARQLVDDPQVFGWAWPVFGTAAAISTVVASWGLRKLGRLQVWAGAHLVMAMGVMLPVLWASLASVVIAALLVGGTFVVITMIAMQEARSRAEGNATVILARMTAGFAFGQLMGPVVSWVLGQTTADYSTALNYALALAGAGLMLSAIYLRLEARQQHLLKVPCHG